MSDPLHPLVPYSLVREFRTPLAIGRDPSTMTWTADIDFGRFGGAPEMVLPATYPEWLGGGAFTRAHGVRFPYVGGAMARGIASVAMVEALAKVGALGFFGAAGLRPEVLEKEIEVLAAKLGSRYPWGSNLIHSHGDARLEDAAVDIYLRHRVTKVSAAAFVDLTPALVRYAVTGLSRGADGSVVRRNHVFAKISRPEVVGRFLSPPPGSILDSLREGGCITPEEDELAREIPLAQDIDVEGDSGGHTDSRPLCALFPAILRQCRLAARAFGRDPGFRVGAAGGMGTPESVAAAFAMGASHVVVGSVHQSCLESGTSERVRQMLANAGVADFAIAPSADMFELGAKVQVLKKGTLMAVRANRLLDLHRRYGSLDRLPPKLREETERDIFRQSLDGVWEETKDFFRASDPRQIERAEHDPKHRMSLVFRWYLGHSSFWPIQGHSEREIDFQIWSGPAMGAFNEWVRGSFLEDPRERAVGQVALNLMEGATYHLRLQQLRATGLPLQPEQHDFPPERLHI